VANLDRLVHVFWSDDEILRILFLSIRHLFRHLIGLTLCLYCEALLVMNICHGRVMLVFHGVIVSTWL
jgi:hypothetical protein